MEGKTGAQSPQNTPAHFAFCCFRVIQTRPWMISVSGLTTTLNTSCIGPAALRHTCRRVPCYLLYLTIHHVLCMIMPHVLITHTFHTSWAIQGAATAVDWPRPAHYYLVLICKSIGVRFFSRCWSCINPKMVSSHVYFVREILMTDTKIYKNTKATGTRLKKKNGSCSARQHIMCKYEVIITDRNSQNWAQKTALVVCTRFMYVP